MSEIAEHIREALTVGPDDVLVVRVADSTHVEQVRRFADQIRDRLPEHMRDRVLVLGGPVEQIACVKGGT